MTRKQAISNKRKSFRCYSTEVIRLRIAKVLVNVLVNGTCISVSRDAVVSGIFDVPSKPLGTNFKFAGGCTGSFEWCT